MSEANNRLEYLYGLFISDKASASEVTEFWTLLEQAEEQEPIKEAVFNEYTGAVPEFVQKKDWSTSLKRILEQKEMAPVVELKRKSQWWWAAAAAVLLMGAAGYFYLVRPIGQPVVVAQKPVPHDVKAPESSRALITLANGQTISLDSAANGELSKQGNIRLVKLNSGQIAYQTASNERTKELQYNTLTNPRGSRLLNLRLSDGTQVWLNAGSSLKYPVAFVGTERRVEITGEAYFEVSHDATKPFHVQKGGTDIAVLGTHFNVNAYEDEEALQVTLLEGSVQVSTLDQSQRDKAVHSVKIKPGQQAIVANQANASTKPIEVQTHVDLDKVMAWKEGFFQFDYTDIKAMLRQLARWYDVDIRYEGRVPNRQFGGRINRQLSLAEVLNLLKNSGVHFKIEGKQLIVMP